MVVKKTKEESFFAVIRRRDGRVVSLHFDLADAAVASARASARAGDHYVRGAKVVIVSIVKSLNLTDP